MTTMEYLDGMEIRAELQPGGEFPRITGYAALFYNGTPDTEHELAPGRIERIASGAFDDALRRADDVRALLNHNVDLLLGRTSSGTLRLWTDSRGLRYEITPPATQLGRQVTEAIRRGDLNGASFGFKAERQRFETEFRSGKNITVRNLLSVKLGDISIATFPAYAGASAELSFPSSEAVSEAAPRNRLAMARRRMAAMG